MIDRFRTWTFAAFALSAASVSFATSAQEDVPAQPSAGAASSPPAVQLKPVTVEDKPWLFNRQTRYDHALPEVDGQTITVTKKASVEKLEQQPTVIDNNQRSLFDRFPGLLIAEQQNPSQLNLTYRGIGNPQESEYILSLQDGVPIALDWIGYPTQYYLPVPQSVDSIQFIRGGSGLLYGPEPQPVINYVSVQPNPNAQFSGTTEQVGGSDGLFSSFNRVSGTYQGLGYLADYAHRRGSGPRENGTYVMDNGDLLLRWNLTSRQKIGFDFHAYSEDNGLPGFLTLAQFQNAHYTTTAPDDHVWVERYTGTLRYDYAWSDRGSLEAKAWTGKTGLATRADTYSAAGVASAPAITQQRFYFTGLDARVVQHWARGNALTVGITGYRSRSPWTVYNDTNPQADKEDHSGTLNYYNDSTTTYGSVFAENVFRFWGIHVVPSVRFDHEEIGNDEKAVGAAHTAPPLHGTVYKNAPLLGIGLGNDFGHGNETYLNISQGYRPVRYRDVTSNSSKIGTSNDPDPTKYVTYEAGVHGWPLLGLYYDASLFQVNTRNRIESQATGIPGQSVNVNSGSVRSQGIEAEGDYDVMRLFHSARAEDHVTIFANASLMHAKITSSTTLENGPGSPTLEDNTPAYAPHYVVKAGISARRDGVYKAALTEQTVGSQYWRDSNQPNGSTPARIPQYTVLDLSADYTVIRHVRLLGGISNLTDRTYYSRVFFVNGGIEPANGRTFYAGAAYDF